MLLEQDVLQWISGDDNYRKIRNDVSRRFLYETQHLQPIVCEYDATDAQLLQMHQHIEGVWSAYGADDPHWSVVTVPRFRRDAIKDNLQEFYDLGRRETAALDLIFARNGIALSPSLRWLEYGCGVGRVTRWLAERAGEITGADISGNHLKLAHDYCRAEGITNVKWVQIKTIKDIELLPRFDVLYSKIVLQHNPPPIIHRILDALLSRTDPGGLAVFQVPTYKTKYVFRLEEYLSKIDTFKALEMHVLPQKVVFDLLHRHGFVPIEVMRDHLVSQADYISNTFVAQKL